MSEDVPPYLSRQFVCEVCGKTFEPSPLEAEALLELERTFGISGEQCSGVCEECAGRQVQ